MIKIFASEDVVLYRKMIKSGLEKNIKSVVTVLAHGLSFFNHLHEIPYIVTIVYILPNQSGLAILKWIDLYNSHIATVLISGQENVEIFIEAYKNGGDYYIINYMDAFSELKLCIAKLTRPNSLCKEVKHLRDQVLDSKFEGFGFVPVYHQNIELSSHALDIIRAGSNPVYQSFSATFDLAEG